MSSDNMFSRRKLSVLGLAGAAAAGGTVVAAPSASAAQAAAAETITNVTVLRSTAGTANQLVNLLGYDTPGRGGGVLWWDATSTEPADDGTVFAVTGVATGRWKRPVTNRVDLSWFGWNGDAPDTDQAPLLRKAIAALPDGGVVELGPGSLRIKTTIRIEYKPVVIQGSGPTDMDDQATQILVQTGTADGFVLAGVRGGGLRDLQVRGVGLQGGALVRTERLGTGDGSGNYMVTFLNVRFRDGFNGVTLRGCNTVRFHNCVWSDFSGEQVILLNGVDDDSRADPVEFVQCAIAAGTDFPDTDNVVLDGRGGSAKFISTAILFGRHGLWLRNTTRSSTDPTKPGTPPKFVYVEGGGFENAHGVPVLLDEGAQVMFANAYISSDGRDDAIRVGEKFIGAATFAGCQIRGAGRHGIDIGSTRVTVTGCVIANNGRYAYWDADPVKDLSIPVSGAANNGAGKVRITTGEPHGWETGDRVTVGAVTGTTEANGKWRVTVVDATRFDLPDVAYTNSYGGGGHAFRHGSGINIRSTAERVVVSGNVIGGLAEGINRQEYGLVNAATDVLVSGNDLVGNKSGAYLITGAQTANTRFTGNRGVDQLDGYLTARVGGAVTDGGYDFGNVLFLDGQRIRVTRVTRKLGAGTCDVELLADSAATGGGTFPASTSLQTAKLDTPFTIDSVTKAKRLRLKVSGAASATDLEVQFGYQVLS